MKLISKVRPSRTFAYDMQEAIKRCVAALKSDNSVTIQSVDPEEGEVRCVWNLKLNKLMGGEGMLVRYSFVEASPGVTVVTAAAGWESGGGRDFLDIGGMYEKIMCKPFEKM